MCHQLRTGFAIGIRIIAVQRVIFAVTVLPFLIFINLVRRHIDERADGFTLSGAFQHMNRTHDIRRIRADRIPVRLAHNRLRCQMEYNLWLRLIKHLF